MVPSARRQHGGALGLRVLQGPPAARPEGPALRRGPPAACIGARGFADPQLHPWARGCLCGVPAACSGAVSCGEVPVTTHGDGFLGLRLHVQGPNRGEF